MDHLQHHNTYMFSLFRHLFLQLGRLPLGLRLRLRRSSLFLLLHVLDRLLLVLLLNSLLINELGLKQLINRVEIIN